MEKTRNWLKILIEVISILTPLFIKYGKLFWEEVSAKYDVKKMNELDKIIIKAMEEGLNE